MPRPSTIPSDGFYSINPVGDTGRSGLRTSRGEYLSRVRQHEVPAPQGPGGYAKVTETRRYRAWSPSETQRTTKDGAELVISAPKINPLSAAITLETRKEDRPSPPHHHAPIRPERLGRAHEALNSHPPMLAGNGLHRENEVRLQGTRRPNSFDRVSVTAVVAEPGSIDFARARGLIREEEVPPPRRSRSEEPSAGPKPAVGPTIAQRKRFGWVASQVSNIFTFLPSPASHDDEAGS